MYLSYVDGFLAQALVGPPPHPFRFGRKGRGHVGVAAETVPNLVGAPQRAIPYALALAGVREALAMPAQEVTPWSVQLGDAPAAGDPIYDAGTDEIGSRSSKPAGDADDTDDFCHVLPITAADAYAIGEM